MDLAERPLYWVLKFAEDNGAFNAAYITAYNKMMMTGCVVEYLPHHTYATIPYPHTLDTCKQPADDTSISYQMAAASNG